MPIILKSKNKIVLNGSSGCGTMASGRISILTRVE
jgi:hypothetical protein